MQDLPLEQGQSLALLYLYNLYYEMGFYDMQVAYKPVSYTHLHHAADALHDDGGQAHLIDALDGVPVRPEAAEVETHLMVFHMVDALSLIHI